MRMVTQRRPAYGGIQEKLSGSGDSCAISYFFIILNKPHPLQWSILFHRALILLRRAPSSWLKHLPKAPLLTPSLVGVRISTYEFRGPQMFRPQKGGMYIYIYRIAICSTLNLSLPSCLPQAHMPLKHPFPDDMPFSSWKEKACWLTRHCLICPIDHRGVN